MKNTQVLATGFILFALFLCFNAVFLIAERRIHANDDAIYSNTDFESFITDQLINDQITYGYSYSFFQAFPVFADFEKQVNFTSLPTVSPTYIGTQSPTQPTLQPTSRPTTLRPTLGPTTLNPTTLNPSSIPTTLTPTTLTPTTLNPTKQPTTLTPTTLNPTKQPTTLTPTTLTPTSIPTTLTPSTLSPTILSVADVNSATTNNSSEVAKDVVTPVLIILLMIGMAFFLYRYKRVKKARALSTTPILTGYVPELLAGEVFDRKTHTFHVVRFEEKEEEKKND